jgi:hypothetical protein
MIGKQSTMGDCFAAARRTIERRWGCHNFEIPVSAVCRTEAFGCFAYHIISELPRFRTIYNEVLAEYRRRYGIRSRSHPVPDLGADGDWLEAPFWGWHSEQPKRERLYARQTANGIELRSGSRSWPVLRAREPDPIRLRPWPGLDRRGFNFRSRALTNTLFARLFLADLFVHGIGGGKYDELTDEIIRRFYHCEPPHYLVLSATRLLPLPTEPVSGADCRQLAQTLRDLHWNPQRHLKDGTMEKLAAAKQEWIDREPASQPARRERFEKLRELTAKLREPLVRRENALRGELAECERHLQTNAVLRRRDYPFVLYPEIQMREFCTQFL